MTIKVLIIDDSVDVVLILTKFLRKLGHEAIAARNGKLGVALVESENPDLILLDIVMPEMDGFETAIKIRENLGKKWVPLIFLTAMTEDQAIAKGIEVGGDDYLIKPVNFVMLKAKIDAFRRMLRMRREIEQKNDELESYYRSTEEEQEVASHLMNQLVRIDTLSDPLLSYWMQPAKRLSGDLLAAARTPHGILHILLGDGTGHGLTASLNVLPVIDPFYLHTSRGSSLSVIARELNSNLKRWLPLGRFVAATIIAYDPVLQKLEIWSGGMPPILIIGKNGSLWQRLDNCHLPLGILVTNEFDSKTSHISVEEGDQVIVFSDGLVDAENEAGEQLGTERLTEILSNVSASDRLEKLKTRITSYLNGWPAHDDISVAIINCISEKVALQKRQAGELFRELPSANDSWQADFIFTVKELNKQVDVVPMLLDLLKQLPDIEPHIGEIFVILSELFNNALEHGLLHLDSRLKGDMDGIEYFINARISRLSELEDGSINIKLVLNRHVDGNALVVEVEDSGEGFDHRSFLTANQNMEENFCPYGRGIMLVRGLCTSLEYFEKGNKARAIYQFS